jgi:hypothetical protein
MCILKFCCSVVFVCADRDGRDGRRRSRSFERSEKKEFQRESSSERRLKFAKLNEQREKQRTENQINEQINPNLPSALPSASEAPTHVHQ